MSDLHVYFGGSFDPPHRGHDAIVRACLQEKSVAQLHVVPTGVNPLKQNEQMGDTERRRCWVQAWLGALGSPRLQFEELELSSPGPHYTVQSLQRLKEALPDSRWVLAVGADVLPDFHRWREPERLLQQVSEVWVFRRRANTLQQLRHELSGSDPLRALDSNLRARGQWRVMPHPIPAISSTELRAALPRLSKEQLQDYVTPEVLALL